MNLPQRAEGGVAAPVVEGVRSPTAGRLLLMVPVVEGGAGELDPNRWIDVAAGAELGRVHEGGERAPSPAVNPAVRLRRNLGDDAGRHRRGCSLGQLDVPVTVALVQPHAPHPARHHEYAVLAPRARCTCVFARDARGRPPRQDLGDEHGGLRSSRKRRVDLLAPAIVGFGAPLRARHLRQHEQPTHAETDGQTRHGQTRHGTLVVHLGTHSLPRASSAFRYMYNVPPAPIPRIRIRNGQVSMISVATPAIPSGRNASIAMIVALRTANFNGASLPRSVAWPRSANLVPPIPTAHSGTTSSSCSAKVTPTSRSRTRSPLGRPSSGARSPRGSHSLPGGCSSTSASRSGTSSGSRRARDTSHRSGRRATGPSGTRRPTPRRGTRASPRWSTTSARCSAWYATPRPISWPGSRTAPDRPYCARRSCSPTTTPITWDSSCCCDACSALGKGTRVTGKGAATRLQSPIGELARRLGDVRATRAVGAANGKNPIPIIVPCHRVVGARGELTGFGGGLDRKRWLLDREGRASILLTPR